MMNSIQPIRGNPGIATFNANMTRMGNERRMDEEEFRSRVNFENAAGTDAALRRGIGAYYADQPPVNEPAPPGVPVSAQPVAHPDSAPAGQMYYTGSTLSKGPPNPAGTQFYQGSTLSKGPLPGATMSPSGAGEFGSEQPLPPQAPATAAPDAQPPAVRAAPSVRPGFSRIQGELAKAPGSGTSMMNLFSADVTSQRNAAVEERKIQAEGHKLWSAALKDGDVKMAQHIGKQYGLQIPDQIYTDRGMSIDSRVAANLAKSVKEDYRHIFIEQFLKARHAGADETRAMEAGNAAIRKQVGEGGFEVKGHFVDKNENVQFYDKRGNTMVGGTARARKAPGGGAAPAAGGGGGSKQVEFANWRIKTLVDGGMPEAQAKQLVGGGASTRPPSPQQRAQLGRQLMNSKDQMGRPIYKTMPDALKAADQALGIGQAPSAAPATAPPPAAGTSAPAAVPGPANQRLRPNFSTGKLEPVP